MKIYLYLANKILSFSLPKKISGSFSFDENPEEESKLINIEANESEWSLYSTTDSNVMIEGTAISSTPLKRNSYYIIRRNNQDYLIYVTDTFDEDISVYAYKEDINLMIGNDQSCNICFPCNLLKGIALIIKYVDGNLMLEKVDNNQVYVNNQVLLSQKQILRLGDQINIYGLKMMFLNNFLLINNPMGIVKKNPQAANITHKTLIVGDAPQDIEVKDIELYTKESYFSKAPRLRRVIKTKEIDLSPPPKQEKEQEMPLLLTIGPMMTMGVMSSVMIINTIMQIKTGQSTLSNSSKIISDAPANVV